MPASGPKESFGTRLRRLREAAGFTQEQLAERAGLSPVAVGALETGKRRRPYPYTVQALADALGLSDEEHSELAELIPRRGAGASQVAIPRRLPVPPTTLIGRNRELEELSRLVRQGARLVTLTGAGGTGKTRLALAVASRVTDAFTDGVAFVALAPLGDPSLVLPTVARVLGLMDAPGQPVLETLCAHLHDEHLLLVLDNFEHVLGSASEVAELLAGCPNLAVLATSRAPLRVRGEREFPVGPLPVPNLDRVPEVAEVAGSPAVELFVERARDISPEFGLTRTNAAAIAAICRRLDGLPLALELAATRVRTLDPTAMLARLDQVLPLLSGGARDLPERQRTMEAAIRWSNDLLNREGQRLFARLSVFSGGWDLEAAEAVGAGGDILREDVLDLLSSLVERSLIAVERGNGVRYRMLEPVRQYALERLRHVGEHEEVRRLHAQHYLELAERVGRGLRKGLAGKWQDQMEAERNNLRTAVSWALSHQEPELAARLAYALWEFFWERGQYGEVRRWMEEALTGGDTMTIGGRARTLFVAGVMRFRLGGYDELLSSYEEVAAAFKGEGHLEGTADILMMAGLAAMRSGDAVRAEGLLEQARRLFESIGAEARIAVTLVFLGAIPLNRGDYGEAEEYFERGLAWARKRGDPRHTYPALYHLAQSAQAKGEAGQARLYYLEVLTLGESIGDKAVIGIAMVGLAECWVIQGEPRQGARLYGAADAVYGSIGMSFHPFTVSASFHDRYVDLARSQLGDEAFDIARAEGKGMSFEQALEFTLAGEPAGGR